MPIRSARSTLSLWLGGLLLLSPLPGSAQERLTYADVAPIFAERCVICHTGEGAPAGLKLDSLSAIKAGSSRGPVVKVGQSADSELVRRLRGTSQPRMPLTGPPWLDAAEVERIAAWIDDGMLAGDRHVAASRAVPAEPSAGEPVTYAHIEPIILQRCVKCHKPDGIMGPPPEGLRLLSYADVLAGNDRVVVVPGKPAASSLLRRIKGYEFPRMPFDGPPWLAEREVRLIERWIADGARNRAGEPAPMPVGRELRLEGRLGPDWHLNDFALDIEAGMQVKKMPSVGDEVRVRGIVQADGSVRLTRVRRR